MPDIVDVIFYLIEAALMVGVGLCATFLLMKPRPLVRIFRPLYRKWVLKKTSPNWDARCRACGSVMIQTSQCPSCGMTEQEALDQNILSYLSVKGGAINKTVTAQDLRVSLDELNESLMRLVKNGHIVQHTAIESERYA